MSLEALPDSNIQAALPIILPVEGAGGIIEALSSNSSLKNEEHLNSIIRMASMNGNLTPGVMQSTIFGKYSTSRSNIGHDASAGLDNLTVPSSIYLQGHGSNNMEPYFSLSSPSMPFSHDGPANGCSTAEKVSNLCQVAQKGEKFQKLGKTKASADSFNLKSQACRESLSFNTNQEPDTHILKKPRYDFNQENVQQQQLMSEFLLKELQERNPQLKAIFMQHRQQSQLQQPILDSAPQIRGLHLQPPKPLIRSLLPEQSNQQVSFTPVLDGGICCRRVMQYLYHLKNRPRDNNIIYWKQLVSEYYAPGSKKRWCFSRYKNFEHHAAGVFCPKSMEAWCCDICGSRSGRGLEATFAIFPRLFKIKFESGMLDEMLFLDLPRARTFPSGLLMLEYGKAIQESVYDGFRVVHEGKLRIVFRRDLKMVSWEFCAQKHEEFLLRKLIAPQVDQLVEAAQKYHNDVQNGVTAGTSSDDLQTSCNMFLSAGHQLAKSVELPLVNDLGYPKRFIRCLQIAEVVNCMQDLMVFSHENNMGPIESLNNLSQGRKIYNQMKEIQEREYFAGASRVQTHPEHPGPGYRANNHEVIASGSGKSHPAMANPNRQFLGQNSSSAPEIRKRQESCLMDSSNQSTGLSPQSLNPYLQNNNPPVYRLPMSQPSEYSKNPNQALIDKLLSEMVAASRGNSTYSKEATHQPYDNTFTSLLSRPMENRANEMRFRESSQDASAQAIHFNASKIPKVASRGNFSSVDSSISIKAEPRSPENVPEAFGSSKEGLLKTDDLVW